MTVTITDNAPAKVNLALHVTGQRADGYHLLDSLVVFTEHGDRIHVRNAQRDAVFIKGPFAAELPDSGDNLVARARNLLRDMTGGNPPVEIILEKNLPVASGIGGGSSDAAATLRALIRLWNVGFDPEELERRALALGADIPMCLRARTLVARGIGEEMVFPQHVPRLSLVLVNPGVEVSTATVFRALESRHNKPMPPLPSKLDTNSLIGWLATARNDLQAPALSAAPVIGDALAALSAQGAAFARMSGSGATCFGVFPSEEAADRAAADIARDSPTWYVRATRTI